MPAASPAQPNDCRNAKASKPRIAIIDRCVPLYRQGLYDVLMADSSVDCTIVAAAVPIERMGTVPFPGPTNSSSQHRMRWRWIDAPAMKIPWTRGACAWQWGAAKAGLSRRFDAIIMMANPNDPCLWLCAIAARLTGKRLIFWTHGLIRQDRPLRRRLRVVWLRLAHAFTTYGHLGKVGCLSEGFDPSRCHVCYNSLDYSRQKSLRAEITPSMRQTVRGQLFGDPNPPIAISLSRLNAFKKIDLLIRAHAQLIRSGVTTRLLIVGDGPERGRLEALVDELRVRDSVKFIGECYDEDRTSSLIAASDVAVTPGAIGLTVMHCMAYGVPCVTHDDWYDQMPEFEAIIDGRTGGFFRKDDVDDLAREMRRWLACENREQISRACITRIERFYRPQIQAAVMLRAVRGEPADDLRVAYETPPEQT